jgi:peroxiredoxin
LSKRKPKCCSNLKTCTQRDFNIVGVSLDKDAAKWKEAIAKDKLTWTHVSNLKFWDEPIAAQYGVQQFQLLLYLMLLVK